MTYNFNKRADTLHYEVLVDEASKMKLLCRFHPQAWVNDYAISVDSEGDTDWVVESNGPVPEDDTYESDELRFKGNAPEWVREWSGPFYVEILNREELT